MTRYSPYLTEKLFCDNLFKKDLNAEQENPTDFCEDVNLKSKEDSAYLSSLSGCEASCIKSENKL